MSPAQLEVIIGHTFHNKALLKEALTHRSYLNENPSWDAPNNERLEFLGDAVLELIVTEELYNRFPQDDEGKLTAIRAALVNYQFLANIGAAINLHASIVLSRGEAKDNGRAREVIVANAMEALIGAIYLDGGYEKTKLFIAAHIMTRLHEVLASGAHRDPKSALQETIQATRKITPNYRVLEETGPEHAKLFKVGVYFENEFVAAGEGYSKQEAELDAAKKALEKN